jgi:hypothetical protein
MSSTLSYGGSTSGSGATNVGKGTNIKENQIRILNNI